MQKRGRKRGNKGRVMLCGITKHCLKEQHKKCFSLKCLCVCHVGGGK